MGSMAVSRCSRAKTDSCLNVELQAIGKSEDIFVFFCIVGYVEIFVLPPGEFIFLVRVSFSVIKGWFCLIAFCLLMELARRAVEWETLADSSERELKNWRWSCHGLKGIPPVAHSTWEA